MDEDQTYYGFSIAIFHRVAYLAFDLPSSPNARLDAYLFYEPQNISHTMQFLIVRPFTSSRTVARVANASRKLLEDMTSMPAMLVCSPWRPQQPDATRMCSGGHNSSKKEHR